MIARVWQARIDIRRADEYDTFARERSVPTFQAHDGFQGCALLGDGVDRVVLTLWSTMDDVEALERSTRYRDTVAEIMGSGFIRSAAPTITARVQPPE